MDDEHDGMDFRNLWILLQKIRIIFKKTQFEIWVGRNFYFFTKSAPNDLLAILNTFLKNSKN